MYPFFADFVEILKYLPAKTCRILFFVLISDDDAVTTEPTPATATRRVSLDYIAALPSSRISRTPAFQNGIGKEMKAC